MPFDSMLVSAAVVAMFTVFAGVVAWGDYQTRPNRLKADTKPQQPEAVTTRRLAA